ncbi:hypothetical protein GCM10025875_17540 [Litorihabitans aurantiacus]|uniref:HTH cro/C1-type domain-containing protein n=2 Tax=Litorihabitans aurantiacus TaxID=1930061 RepID=A0AA37XEN4_9MICO|nr:hypothetical protein GCM10025875_17540 [Litorihabitans aurantiacus]
MDRTPDAPARLSPIPRPALLRAAGGTPSAAAATGSSQPRRTPVTRAGYRGGKVEAAPGAARLAVVETGPREGRAMILLRRELGDVLRDVRLAQSKTLREVSASARVSLGYLSEIERGQKEASSELLSSVCDALDVPLWGVLREVSDRIAIAEGEHIPDTVPADLEASVRPLAAAV